MAQNDTPRCFEANWRALVQTLTVYRCLFTFTRFVLFARVSPGQSETECDWATRLFALHSLSVREVQYTHVASANFKAIELIVMTIFDYQFSATAT